MSMFGVQTKTMINEKIILKAGKPFLKPIGIAQGIFVMVFIGSPFVWLWLGWALAWKIGLTGIIGTLLCFLIYELVKSIVKDHIEEQLMRRR